VTLTKLDHGAYGAQCSPTTPPDPLVHFSMTKIELAREIARRTPARIVEIEWTGRGTAYRNMLKRYSAKAALERELERLAEEWSR
jgi:hypothetical protein